MKRFFEKYYWLVFAGIAIVLIYPSFSPGYIFALDWAISPFITWSDIVWTNPVGWVICDIFSVILTSAIFQRILLFAIITLAGIAGFRAAKNTHNIFAQYFAGLFLIFNPFFYARMIEQTMLIGAGIVALVWFWIFLMESLEEGNIKKMIGAAVCAALAVSFFAHSIFFVGLIFFAFTLKQYVIKEEWKKFFMMIAIFWVIVLCVNGNWIIASATEGNTWASKVVNFTQDDLDAFRTRKIGGHSVYTTVLSLQGYWGEYQDRFVSVQDNFLWSSAFVLIFMLALYGVIRTWRDGMFTRTFVMLFLIAYVLAIGVASPVIKPYVLLLYEHVPYYIGLREPQKWVAVMMFIYAYMGAWGLKSILDHKKTKEYRTEVGLLCVILPVVFSFSMIRGVHEYVVPQNFPAEWHEVRNFLQTERVEGKVLFLPWHSYLYFDFAQKNITNPAKRYFGTRVISGNNVEFGKVYSNFSDAQTHMIQKYVSDGKNTKEFAYDLCTINVQTVIVAKAEDWQNYLWIDHANGIQKVMENAELIVYAVENDCDKTTK